MSSTNGVAGPTKYSSHSSFQNNNTSHNPNFKQGSQSYSKLPVDCVVYGDKFIILSYRAGIPNGGTPEDGFLPSDRRSGRRGRRQRSSTRFQDGKNQGLLLEKDNIEVTRSHDSLQTGGMLYALIRLCHLLF